MAGDPDPPTVTDLDVGLERGTLDLLILEALTQGPHRGYGVVGWIERATDAAIAVGEGSPPEPLGALRAE